MFLQFELNNNFQVIKIALIIAIIFGVATSVFFMVVQKDYYSAIYLVPGSIRYNSDDNSVLYMYGVKSSESGKMDYKIDTYLDNKLIKTKQFSLDKGEILDGQDKIIFPPDTKYPSKISLILSTNAATEEVHFWIKDRL